MSRQATTSRGPVVGPARGRPRSVRDIEDVIGSIAGSDEPAVVLSSLARASNPSFSDACAIELSEGVDALFQVSFPLPGDATFPAARRSARAGASPIAGKTVTTAFQAASGHRYPSFAGVVVHSWIEHDPTEDDAIIARLLVDHALAIVQRERLAQSVTRADDRAAKLAMEMITSCAEGEAIGILMTKHQATRQEAVGLLRKLSRTSHRELHEVAADVVSTRDLQRLQDCADVPARRQHLQIAASYGHEVARPGTSPDASPTPD